MKIDIREWRLSDKKDLAEFINNKKILDNLRDGIPFPYTENHSEEFINKALAAEKGKYFYFAIIDDDKAIGSIGVFRHENIHYRTAEIGYFIDENYWNQGVMSLSLKKTCDYIFENTDIVRIFAMPFAHNKASVKVLENCGFQYEGILRKNAFKNGEFLDMIMYSLIV